jgi:hypothetical protein
LQVVEGNIVEGEQLYNIVKNENAGSVDLGSLNYNYTASATPSFSSNLVTKTNSIGISPLYTIIPTTSIENSPNMSIQMRGNIMYIVNHSYTDAATFKAAMSGVMLNYERATPTQTVIAQDLHFDQVSALIEQGGTITMLNTGTPTKTTTTFVVKKAVGE